MELLDPQSSKSVMNQESTTPVRQGSPQPPQISLIWFEMIQLHVKMNKSSLFKTILPHIQMEMPMIPKTSLFQMKLRRCALLVNRGMLKKLLIKYLLRRSTILKMILLYLKKMEPRLDTVSASIPLIEYSA